MKTIHPSRRFKRVAKAVAAIGLLSVLVLAINKATINDEVLKSLSQIGLLFFLNMLVALPFRHCMKRTTGKLAGIKTGIATLVICMLVVLLYLDFSVIAYVPGDESSALTSVVATFISAVIWIAAYVISWKPFLKQPENQFVAAVISVGLTLLAIALYFASMLLKDYFGGTGWKIEFIQFCLVCISMASALSSLVVQWDKRTRAKTNAIRESIDGDSITIRNFFPSSDLSEAERFATVGMGLDRYSSNPLESWAFGYDLLCCSVARSTHLISAYYEDQLAGFIFADIQGFSKPYEKSFYAVFHTLFDKFENRFHPEVQPEDEDSFIRGMMIKHNLPCDAEIVMIAVNPDLQGLGIGSKLVCALEQALSGCRVFLVSDNDSVSGFFEKHGFKRIECFDSEVISDESNRCFVFMKTI